METDIAWAAGFFDGEGSVMLSPRGSNGSYYTLYITVGQVNKRPLLKFQTLFGGPIKQNAKTSAGNPFHVWRLASVKASIALEKMLPFLVDKTEEVTLALQMQTLKKKGKRLGTIRYTDTDHTEFKKVYLQFSEVKATRRKGKLGLIKE